MLGRARHIEAGGSASLADDQLAPLLDDVNTPAAMAQLKKLATDLDAAVRKACAREQASIKPDPMALAEVIGFLGKPIRGGLVPKVGPIEGLKEDDRRPRSQRATPHAPPATGARPTGSAPS